MKKALLVTPTFLFALALRAHAASSCPASVPSGITNCYYIDYNSGSDSNSGTSESTPWKHAPGMQGLTVTGAPSGDGCTANCATNSPVAGNGYILKGGSIWPYTTAPWNWIWSGTSTQATFGCTGAGCIYVGYDPKWNQGIVNSVTLTRDLGGCSPSSPPTVAFSGGEGSGATATAEVIPAAAGKQEPNVAGFIYHVAVTSQGSGYRSNPNVTIRGGGCRFVGAVADIERPVLDYGKASGVVWPAGSGKVPSLAEGPGIAAFVHYVIFDHLELRNVLQAARCVNGVPCGISVGFITIGTGGNSYITVENTYIHGRFTDCVLKSCNSGNQEEDDSAININDSSAEISGNVLENGDAYYTGTHETFCPVNFPCTFSEQDAKIVPGTAGSSEMKNNILYSIRWMTHWGGNARLLPALIHDNEMWLALYDVGGAHINEMYLEYSTGTVYNYNNIFHNCVSGTSNQQQVGNGTTQYFFNNVSWGLGGGTDNYGLDPATAAGPGGGRFYFYNNTMYSNSWGTTQCINSGSGPFNRAMVVTLQNNHCITNQDPFYGNQAPGSTWKDQSGSTAVGNVQASNTVDSSSAAASQGYVQANLYAPKASSNHTVTFASKKDSVNLTSLCTGYLVPLCRDINGNSRPATGGWQSGAYWFGASAPTTGRANDSEITVATIQ